MAKSKKLEFNDPQEATLDLPNPEELVKKAIDANLDSSVFSIDESDIEWCPNIIEWVTEPKFLSAAHPPFPKQMQWMLQLFEDYCPECSDYEYIQDVPVGSTFEELLDRVQPLEFGMCPKCGKNRFDFNEKNLFHFPHEINVCAGMRSGKTACAGMITSYHIHKFLKLPTPAKTFGLLTGKQTLYGTFTATTAGQAEQTLWKAFVDLLDGSTWYQEYIGFLREKGAKLGQELYRQGDTFVYFTGKRIWLSYAPADMKKLRGRTRLICVTGETLVATNHGLVRADALNATQDQYGDLSVDTREHGFRPVTDFQKTTSKTKTFTTDSGYELTASLDHPVLCVNKQTMALEYTQTGDLQESDIIVLKKGFHFSETVPEFPETEVPSSNNQQYFPPMKLTKNLAWLFGYLLAYGAFSSRGAGVKWVTIDPYLRDKSRRIFEESFGKAPPCTYIEDEHPHWYIAAQGPVVGRFFKNIGLGGGVREKAIPECILRAPEAYVAAFVAGYFDGDGGRDKNGALRFTGINTEVIKQVQVLLLGLGIVSRRRLPHVGVRPINGKNPKDMKDRHFWSLGIYGENIDRFHEKCSSMERKRCSTKKRICTEGGDSSETGIADVPTYVTRGTLCPDGEWRNLSAILPLKKKGKRSFTTLTEERLGDLSVLDAQLAKNTQILVETKDWLFLDPIKNIEEAKEQAVYDITVSEAHNFIANGVSVRNCGVDEIGFMDDNPQRVTANADETYEALIKSLRTVRSGAEEQRRRGNFDIPDGLMINISSPCSASDKIMRLVEESTKDPRRVWDHVSTWEANPTIREEDLASEKRANYVTFLRDYAAIPPMAHNPFISDETSVLKLADKNISPPGTMVYETIKDDTSDGYYVTARLVSCVRDKGTPRILTMDAGESYCSFSGTLCHYDSDTDRALCDMIFEVIPREDDLTGKWPVHFPSLFEHTIERVCEDLNIIHVVTDRWNSTQIIQSLRMNTPKRRSVEAEKYTLKWSDFVNFRARVMQGNWRFPYPEMDILARPEIQVDSIVARRRKRMNLEEATEVQQIAESLKDLPLGNPDELQKVPNAHLLRQILTVKEVGRKVIKPSNDQDDIFRCLCLADRYIFENRDLYAYSGVTGQRLNTQGERALVTLKKAGNSGVYTRRNSSKVVVRSQSSGIVTSRFSRNRQIRRTNNPNFFPNR